ncbi:MAG: AAA family ATPase [Gammaproteobacteria bacterium]|nr:AAA family ATPase [Gammaproteobacteria bacterium]
MDITQSTNSIARASSGMLDNMQAAQQHAQATHNSNQGGSSTPAGIATPAPPQPERWANIPAALRDRPQWVLASANKHPLTADGRTASSTDPATWCDFDTATIAAQKKGLHIGYTLHEDDPFTCIDLDVKETTPQEHIELFDRIVTSFDSYTERSRSGKGLHVWVEGNIGSGRRCDGVEVYSQERFIICTGDVVSDKPIAARPELLNTLVAEMRAQTPDVELTEVEPTDNDETIWERASKAANGGKFCKLWDGRWQGDYPSQSEADFALLSILTFHSKSNEQVRRLFRMSALGKREKAQKNNRYLNTSLIRIRSREQQEVAHGKAIAEALFWRPKASSEHFRILSDKDLAGLPPQRWLVKNIIPEGGIGTIFGQSGTFKSFLALDLLAHVANGQPWFGHRVKAAPAVYVPFEGRGGIPKRVAAWKLHRSHETNRDITTNMAFITDPMNLRDAGDREKLVRTLIDRGWAGGVLCIDTLAQAGAGIDENSSEGMGEMIAVFQELQHKLGGTVLVIHHSGKVESAGMRGWSGLRGALDFSIKCQKEEGKNVPKLNAQFVLDKVKDGEDGKTFDFSMLPVHLGYDEDDEGVSSLTVIPRINPQEPAPVSDVMRDSQDDDFIEEWIKGQVDAGNFPSKNSLKQQLSVMKEKRNITQQRIGAAIERLMACSRVAYAPSTSPSGNKWLRVMDTPHVDE